MANTNTKTDIADPADRGPSLEGAFLKIIPRMGVPLIGILGDSIAELQSVNTSTGRYMSSSGMVNWACALLHGRMAFNPALNYGVGGEASNEVLARTATAITAFVTAGVKFCFVSAGTNDVFEKRASALTIADIKAIAILLRDAGITPLVNTIMPRTYDALATGGERTTARNQQSYINAELRKWALTTPGIILIDLVRRITDPASAAGEPLGGAANPEGFTYDRLHPAPRLGYVGGKVIAAALDPFIPPRIASYQTLIDVYHATENLNGNKLTNGKLTGTTGTDGTGASGDFATSWTASRYAGSTATIVGSKVTETDADGGASTEWQRCVVAASGGTGRDSVRLRQTVSAASAKYATGDIVKMRMRVKIVAADGLLGATPELVQQNASINTAVSTGLAFYSVSSVNYLWPELAWEGVIETPPMTILSDVVNLQCDLQIHVDAASATVTVDFADAELIPA
jgi:hypothetical protein